jgi:hypothetical protein
MAARSAEELRRDQMALLEAYRQRLGSSGAGDTASVTSPGAALPWGQVTQVVTSDPDYGPHLMVQGQIYTGSPPAPADAPAAPLRCYPAPGKAVGDYSVNDYVRLAPTAGAVIAEQIA